MATMNGSARRAADVEEVLDTRLSDIEGGRRTSCGGVGRTGPVPIAFRYVRDAFRLDRDTANTVYQRTLIPTRRRLRPDGLWPAAFSINPAQN